MPKALMAGVHGQTLTSGEEWLVGSHFNGATEAQSQYQATEQATFSGLRGNVFSGNSGTATFTFRNNGGNGNQVVSIAGTGEFEDRANSDTVAAGNTFNGAYIDTLTDSVVLPIAVNVQFASGHGNFHAASGSANLVMDVASSTRYLPINGIAAIDGVAAANIANVQFKVREYTSIAAFQIRINANARLNNSVFSMNVNGVDVGTPITFATLATGLQAVTGMGIALSPGDLVCISMTLGTGVEDLNFGFDGTTFKSTDNASAAGYGIQAGTARAASATPNYYSVGSGATTTEANARVKVGFAARCKNLRCYLSANTYGTDATLRLFVNGAPVLTTTITAGGGAGWYENATGGFDIGETDVISFEVAGGTSGSITIHQIWISFFPIPVALSYGIGRAANDYEDRVRAKWDQIEALERQRQAAEERQRDREARISELQRQQTELDERKRLESRTSALARRRGKIEREIAAIRQQQDEAEQIIAALVSEIAAVLAAQSEQALTADRRRRMVLLLAAAA